jgi:hypothetical protein
MKRCFFFVLNVITEGFEPFCGGAIATTDQRASEATAAGESLSLRHENPRNILVAALTRAVNGAELI